jgi:5'(3')-deoxyribonucleotidase
MKAYFPKNMPCPSLVISSEDEIIQVSIAADDSCGNLDSYRRFNIWFEDKNTGEDSFEDGFNLPKVILWLTSILVRDFTYD